MKLAAEVEHINAVDYAYVNHNSTGSSFEASNKQAKVDLSQTCFKTKQQMESQTYLPIQIGKTNKRILSKANEKVWRPSMTDSKTDPYEPQPPMRARTSQSITTIS